MAVTNRSGVDGTAIALFPQTAYGTPVKQQPTLSGGAKYPLFPVSAITLDEDADIEESNLITAFGAAPPVEIGQLYAQGGFTTRILPEYFYHILEGVLNPTKNASTALPESATFGAIAAGSFTPVGSDRHKYPGHGSPLEDVGWPSKVKFGTVSGGGDGKTIKIVGRRRAGRDHASGDDRLSTFYQEEVIEIGSSDTSAESKYYYYDVANDGITASAGVAAATVTFDPNTYKTTVQFQATDPEFPGWTALVLKGGTPNRVTDWVPGEMAIAAGPTGIDVTTTGVGTRYDEHRTIPPASANFDDPVYKLSTQEVDTYYENLPINAFPGWAGALLFGDEVVKYTGIDFNINRNYENDPGVDGVRFKYGVSATANRLVTFSPTSYLRSGDDAADNFLKMQELFRNGTREELIMRNLAYDADGAQSRMDWVCGEAQIASAPRAEVSGPGPIERPTEFRALPGTGGVAEIVVVMWTRAQIYT